MKFFPAEPQVKLYEEGFEEQDVLERRKVGKSLSDLVERVEDPVVVALSGGWGTGKTYFLKRWVGAHTIENGGSAKTLYFDAFAHDYLSDPLPALVAALSERFPRDDENALGRIKEATFKLAKPAARVGLAMATFGATEALAPVGDAAARALKDEASSAMEAYWSQEDGRRVAIREFRSALSALLAADPIEGNEEKPSGAKLVIVIDELDRCRPDYALELLEVAKHFFEVPGITFILGVNLAALENSVKARYGNEIDAGAYLRKFISISLSLPSEIGERHNMKSTLLVYLNYQLQEMGIPNHIADALKPHIEIVCRNNRISIRDLGKILGSVALLSDDVLKNERTYIGWIDVAITLIVSKVICPMSYEKFLSLSMNTDDLERYFDATIRRRRSRDGEEFNREFDNYTMALYCSWLYLMGDRNLSTEEEDADKFIRRRFSEWSSGPDNPGAIPKRIQEDWLNVF